MAGTTLLTSEQWASVQWVYDSPQRMEVTVVVDSGGGTAELYRQDFNSDESVGGYYDTRAFFGSIHRLVITAKVGGMNCPESGFGENQSRLTVFRDPRDPTALIQLGAAFIHVFSERSSLRFLVAGQPGQRGTKKGGKKATAKSSSEKGGGKRPGKKGGAKSGGTKKAGAKKSSKR